MVTKGLTLYNTEEEINELGQTENLETPFKISQEELEKVNIDLKIDITPQSPYDRLALEVALENMLLKGIISLEEYTEALPDNSASPKTQLQTLIRKRKEARKQITAMQMRANAINSAVQQEMADQQAEYGMNGGMVNEMSNMQNGGDGSMEGISRVEQVPAQV